MHVTQNIMRHALLDRDQPVPDGLSGPKGRPAGRRFAVYRNNVAVALTEALELGFPAVRKLIGETNFRAVMGAFLRQHPPDTPIISQYGAALPGFLREFAPLSHIPYLPDMAELEQALRRIYHAADSTPIDPGILQELAPDKLLGARFTLAPALCVVPSRWPIHAIWRYNMENGPKPVPGAENVLITRPEFDPVMTTVPLSAARFIKALQAGRTLGMAHDAAISDNPEFDLSASLVTLLGAQAITAISESHTA